MEQKRYKRYKNILEKFLDSGNGKRFFNIVYSIGAAIVILGAMFKLLHLPAGNIMLMIGMITEAIVFTLSAFEKPDKDYKWEEVYPVLADDDNFKPRAERKSNDNLEANNIRVRSTSNSNATNGNNTGQQINNVTSSPSGSNNNQQYTGGSNYNGSGTINNGSSLSNQNNVAYANKNVSNQTNNNSNSSQQHQTTSDNNAIYTGGGTTVIGGGTVFTDGSNVTEASEKYADQLTKMSENMAKFAEVTNSLSTISDTLLKSFQTIIDNSTGIGSNTQGYITQMETLNRNVAGLNTIYEIQLKGVSGQINTIEEINAGLDRMKKLYTGSLADSSLFKNETEKMAKQLSELNVVYARLLQAMTANMNMGGNGGFNPNTNNTQP